MKGFCAEGSTIAMRMPLRSTTGRGILPKEFRTSPCFRPVADSVAVDAEYRYTGDPKKGVGRATKDPSSLTAESNSPGMMPKGVPPLTCKRENGDALASAGPGLSNR